MSTLARRRQEGSYSIAQRLVENSWTVFVAETLALLGTITIGWFLELSLVALVATVAASSLLIVLAVALLAPSPEERQPT
jgi:hypothetical protein